MDLVYASVSIFFFFFLQKYTFKGLKFWTVIVAFLQELNYVDILLLLFLSNVIYDQTAGIYLSEGTPNELDFLFSFGELCDCKQPPELIRDNLIGEFRQRKAFLLSNSFRVGR